MNIVVPIKFVPDPVEDLQIDPSSGLLDRSFLRLIPSELDEHALEQALILKERHGGTVTVVACDTGDVDETLFTALARGADRAVKITGDDFQQGIGSRRMAAIIHAAISGEPCDLVLTGTQALDDMDGFVGALLAERMGVPYIGYVTKVEIAGNRAAVRKEYPGGLNAEIETALPAVLGIQAAEKPPRYVVTAKVMEAMKSRRIDEKPGEDPGEPFTFPDLRMALPEPARRAEMLDGSPAQVAQKIVALLRERGLVG